MRIAGEERWAAVEDAARLRDALGAPCRSACRSAFLEPVRDPLGDLVARYARTHGPFHVGRGGRALRARDRPSWAAALDRLAAAGRVVAGEFLPGGAGHEWCDAEVLRTLRRRSLAALRKEVEPVPVEALSAFLPAWQQVGGRLRGAEGVLRAVEQLQGAQVPASALESLVLPARVAGYSPAMLDELCAAGEVVWRGHGSLPGSDGWVSLHLADAAHLTLPEPDADAVATPLHESVLATLDGGGAFFFRGSPTRSARPTTRRWSRRCGTSSGPATSPTTPSRRCGSWSPAAVDGAAARTRAGPRPRAAATGAHDPAWRDGRRCRPAPARRPRPVAGRCCPTSSRTRPGGRTRWPRSCSTGTACSPGVRSWPSG